MKRRAQSAGSSLGGKSVQTSSTPLQSATSFPFKPLPSLEKLAVWLMRSRQWGLVLAYLAGALPVAASAQNEALYATSYKLEAEKRYEAAAQSIQALADAGSEFAQLRLGWLAYLQGNFNASVSHYDRLLQNHPTAIEARIGLMLPLMAQERWQDAAAQAYIILQQSPWEYTTHLRLLACQEALKQWDLVEAHATALAAAYPSDVSALVYLGRARARQNNAIGARQAYVQVLERSPLHQEAVTFLKSAPPIAIQQ